MNVPEPEPGVSRVALALLAAWALTATAAASAPDGGAAADPPDDPPASTGAPPRPSTTGEAPQAPAPSRPEAEPGIHAAALPLASYGSDVGVQLGGAAYLYAVDARGERQSWGALGVTWTARGPRSLELKGEVLRLLGTPLRTFIQVKGALDTNAPYFGEGAALGAGPPGAGAPPPAYSYESTGPWLSAIVRGPLAGPLAWWTRLRYADVAIAHPGAVLAASAPRGFAGGSSALAHLGLAYDTRQGGASPRRGFVADASAFAAPPELSSYGFGGFDAGVRAYFPLSPSTVLAARALYDVKLGAVPFFERALYEGLAYGEGLGGAGTIRGLARDRLMGEEKALLGAELRAWLTETRWLGRPQAWGASLGVDAGRARDRGRDAVYGAGGFVGGRLLWDRSVVVRFEVGYAGAGEPAFYIGFDEAF